MDRTAFHQRLQNEVLILDGAMGTLLQPHFLPGACLEMANLEHPEFVEKIYHAYQEAGADIVSTNTFGANRIKLAHFGLEKKVQEINIASARLARKSLPPPTWIAGVIGPTGKLVEPLGDLLFDQAYEVFREQALALAQGGADCILLETFSDIREIKAAVMAVRDHTSLPIMASMTFEPDYRTFTGTDPVTAATVLMALDVDAIGVNCSMGPEPMLEILGQYALSTPLPLFVEPNAGLPQWEGGKIRYEIHPVDMAQYALRFWELGAAVMGTCCGSSPEHTRAIKETLGNRKPVSRSISIPFRISSRVQTVAIGEGLPFCVIGERINPTHREDLIQALRSRNLQKIRNEALRQIQEGAKVIDVNVGVPGLDQSQIFPLVIRFLSEGVSSPLAIDSTSPEAIELALREIPGKALVNSVNGDPTSMHQILPLAKRYGAGVVCLAIDEKGIPQTAEERIQILRRILEEGTRLGIPKSDFIADPVTLTVSAEQKRAEETLHTIRRIKTELGFPTVLGLSNISFGLPERSLLNATFLAMAMAHGLDAAILNPGDTRVMDTIRAGSVLTVRDPDSKEFIRTHRVSKSKSKPSPKPSEGIEEKIAHAILSGDREGIKPLINLALEQGLSAEMINTSFLIPAIREIGDLYEKKIIFLPQMILAAETMQKALEILSPYFEKSENGKKGKVIICTVKGDIHDIGKNIVALFLKNQGIDVMDLGKDVPCEVIVQKAIETRTDVVALSALMTTTMIEMPKVIQALRKFGARAKVIVGGAVVTEEYARQIGADGYGKDGPSGANLVRMWLNQAQ